MAYRRRQGMSRASTFKDDALFHRNEGGINDDVTNSKLRTSHTFTSTSSLAAQAIKASAAHRDSSLSSAYAANSIPQSFRSNKVFAAYDNHTSGRNETGFWGVLARKAKAILDEDLVSQQLETDGHPDSRFQMPPETASLQTSPQSQGFNKTENPALRKGLDKITSSLNQIGDTFEKAFEEGRTIVENKTADIIQETRKLQVRRNGNDPNNQQLPSANASSWQPLGTQETQLKASRDVAMATAAKAKLLLRELKTVKADLAFAKLRCSQLEDENKSLRENREKGGSHTDDDLIRLQLETLLAEKSRLANENSVYSRENRFLREIVEYHQLTMQDVVYLDEGNEEVTEVYPLNKMLSISPSSSPRSPTSPFKNHKSKFLTEDAPDDDHIPTSIEEEEEEMILELLAGTDDNQNYVGSMQEQGETGTASTPAGTEEDNYEGASKLKEDHIEVPQNN